MSVNENDEGKRYLVYDPKSRKWLAYADGSRAWTDNNREAHQFTDYRAANVVRCQIENDGDCGNHELYVTERREF